MSAADRDCRRAFGAPAMTDPGGHHHMNDEIEFPTTTIDSVEFSGAGAMKPNFKGEIKFEVANLPQVLVQLQGLHATKGRLVFVSDQSQIAEAGDAGSWATARLEGDPQELAYEEHCIGAACPHFTAHTKGEFEGKYVCEQSADVGAYIEVVYGETYCPLFPVDAPDGYGVDELALDVESASTDEGGSDSATESQVEKAEPNVSVVIVLYPGSDEPVVTKIGEKTRYGELVADYFTAAGLNGKHDAKDWQVRGEDDGFLRNKRDIIGGSDYGKRLIVEMTPEAAIVRQAAEPAA